MNNLQKDPLPNFVYDPLPNFVEEFTDWIKTPKLSSANKMYLGCICNSAKEKELSKYIQIKIRKQIKEISENLDVKVEKIKIIFANRMSPKNQKIESYKKEAADILSIKVFPPDYLEHRKEIFKLSQKIVDADTDEEVEELVNQLENAKKLIAEEIKDECRRLQDKNAEEESLNSEEDKIWAEKCKNCFDSAKDVLNFIDLVKLANEIKKLVDEDKVRISAKQIKKDTKVELEKISNIERILTGKILNEDYLNKLKNYKDTLQQIPGLKPKETVDFYESKVKESAKDFHQNIDKVIAEFNEITKKDIEILNLIKKFIKNIESIEFKQATKPDYEMDLIRINSNDKEEPDLSTWVNDSLSLLDNFLKTKKSDQFFDLLIKYEDFSNKKTSFSLETKELYEKFVNKNYVKKSNINLLSKFIKNSNASPELVNWTNELFKRLEKLNSSKPEENYDIILEIEKAKLPPALEKELTNLINNITDSLHKISLNPNELNFVIPAYLEQKNRFPELGKWLESYNLLSIRIKDGTVSKLNHYVEIESLIQDFMPKKECKNNDEIESLIVDFKLKKRNIEFLRKCAIQTEVKNAKLKLQEIDKLKKQSTEYKIGLTNLVDKIEFNLHNIIKSDQFKITADLLEDILLIETDSNYRSLIKTFEQDVKKAESKRNIEDIRKLITECQDLYKKIESNDIPEEKLTFHQSDLRRQFGASRTKKDFDMRKENFEDEIKKPIFDSTRKRSYTKLFEEIKESLKFDFLDKKIRPKNIEIKAKSEVTNIQQILDENPLLENNLVVLLNDFTDFIKMKNNSLYEIKYFKSQIDRTEIENPLLTLDMAYKDLIIKIYTTDNAKTFADNLYDLGSLYDKRYSEFQRIFERLGRPNNHLQYLIKTPITMHDKIKTGDPLEKKSPDILIKLKNGLEKILEEDKLAAKKNLGT
jgi:hypothetical protein